MSRPSAGRKIEIAVRTARGSIICQTLYMSYLLFMESVSTPFRVLPTNQVTETGYNRPSVPGEAQVGQDVRADDQSEPAVHAGHKDAVELLRLFVGHAGQIVALSHGITLQFSIWPYGRCRECPRGRDRRDGIVAAVF